MTDIISCFYFWFFLLCIWIGLFWFYKEHMIELFRGKMFELRDSFFDAAAGGLIDFDHPAYGLLRETMNGFIRFAHRLSLMEFFFIIIAVSHTEKTAVIKDGFNAKWQKATKNLPSNVVKELEGFRDSMQRIVIAHLLKSSVFLTALIIPVGIYMMSKEKIIETIRTYCPQPVNNIETTAMAVGK